MDSDKDDLEMKDRYEEGFVENAESEEFDPEDTASMGTRFINFILDRIVIVLFSYTIGGIIGLIGIITSDGIGFINRYQTMSKIEELIVGIIISLLFYAIFEGFFGVTPGKIVTKTRVVSDDGYALSFGSIVGRSLARFIPFDALSFLWTDGVGWHDTLSNTRVVKDKDNRSIMIPAVISVLISIVGALLFFMTLPDYF